MKVAEGDTVTDTPSGKSRKQQLAALRDLAGIPIDPPAPHYDYTPKMPAEHWNAIEDFVRRVVQRTAPLTAYSEKQLYPAASRLALFAWATAGLPLEDDVVFDPGVIERFTRAELATYSHAGRNTIRARLRRMSEALLGDEARGRFRALGKAESSRPYTDADVASLLSWAAAQQETERQTSASALLALGLGAGLTGQEIIRLRVEDISEDADGVVVSVTGDGARDVPVLHQWETFLLERKRFVGPIGWAFRSGQRGGNVNLVTDFASRRPAPAVPLQARRMRATWLSDHLTAGTPLGALLPAAGLESAEALDRVLQATFPLDPDLARVALRGNRSE